MSVLITLIEYSEFYGVCIISQEYFDKNIKDVWFSLFRKQELIETVKNHIMPYIIEPGYVLPYGKINDILSIDISDFYL